MRVGPLVAVLLGSAFGVAAVLGSRVPPLPTWAARTNLLTVLVAAAVLFLLAQEAL